MGLFGKQDPPRPAAAEPVVAPQTAAAPARPAARTTVIGEKTRYTGKVETDEPLVLHGRIEGEIHSTSEVEIGETGEVKGTIVARNLMISGRVSGDCSATERLEIRSSGRLNGGIKAARIAIADGAEFKGTSQMAPASRS